MSQLLGVAGNLVTSRKGRDTQHLLLPPFATSRVCLQDSQVPDSASGACGFEAVPTVKKDKESLELVRCRGVHVLGNGCHILPRLIP